MENITKILKNSKCYHLKKYVLFILNQESFYQKNCNLFSIIPVIIDLQKDIRSFCNDWQPESKGPDTRLAQEIQKFTFPRLQHRTDMWMFAQSHFKSNLAKFPCICLQFSSKKTFNFFFVFQILCKYLSLTESQMQLC